MEENDDVKDYKIKDLEREVNDADLKAAKKLGAVYNFSKFCVCAIAATTLIGYLTISIKPVDKFMRNQWPNASRARDTYVSTVVHYTFGLVERALDWTENKVEDLSDTVEHYSEESKERQELYELKKELKKEKEKNEK